MENKTCSGCIYLYEVHKTGYWKCWCKLFKYWLVSEDKEVIRNNECIELEGKK
jgi:hypothetical protein